MTAAGSWEPAGHRARTGPRRQKAAVPAEFREAEPQPRKARSHKAESHRARSQGQERRLRDSGSGRQAAPSEPSTSPAASKGHKRAKRLVLAPSRWSLRTRLLALLIALLAAVSASIVGVTALVLRSYLVRQVDERVVAVDRRWIKPSPGDRPDSLGGPPSGTGIGENGNADAASQSPSSDGQQRPASPPAWKGTPKQFLGQRGQPPGALAARIVGGEVENAVILEPGGVIPQLPVDVAAKLTAVPVDDKPRTVSLGSYGDFRVTARLIPDGSTVVISGLSLAEVNATVNQLILIAGCVAGVGVLLLGVVGAVTVRRTLRPLRRVASTAAKVAELPLDRGAVTLLVRVPDVDTDPRTEVGQVGAALNHMLGHVSAALAARHASETRVRQFVADASHELRTPLAAISGYAQLTRRIGDDVPPEFAYALRRVESETKRMTALVEDLLLLARLDSGRPLEHGSVDLSRLVVDVLSDAHIAAPRHRFSLSLPAEPVTVSGDEARLHQVLANLLANTRTHTPPGTSVTVALEIPTVAAGGASSPPAEEVRLSVTDDGPGISAELLPNVFERFARADSSRSRAGGSTGLGLAIVAAVVEAHGGKISVTSAPGRTTFTVALPRTVPTAAPMVAGDLSMADALYAPDEACPADDPAAQDDLYAPHQVEARGPARRRTEYASTGFRPAVQRAESEIAQPPTADVTGTFTGRAQFTAMESTGQGGRLQS